MYVSSYFYHKYPLRETQVKKYLVHLHFLKKNPPCQRLEQHTPKANQSSRYAHVQKVPLHL